MGHGVNRKLDSKTPAYKCKGTDATCTQVVLQGHNELLQLV